MEWLRELLCYLSAIFLPILMFFSSSPSSSSSPSFLRIETFLTQFFFPVFVIGLNTLTWNNNFSSFFFHVSFQEVSFLLILDDFRRAWNVNMCLHSLGLHCSCLCAEEQVSLSLFSFSLSFPTNFSLCELKRFHLHENLMRPQAIWTIVLIHLS